MAEAMEPVRRIAAVPRPLPGTSRPPTRREVSRPIVMGETSPAVATEERINLPIPTWLDVVAYQRDLWERSVLFLDTLRQRSR